MADMNKKTPLVIFTGLAVAAAGTLGAMLTGNFPGVPAPQTVSEAVLAPVQPAAQPEASAAAPAASAEQQVAAAPAQDPAPAPAPQPAAEQPIVDPSIPAFDTVNVMPTGDAVIAGHAKPGSEVVIKFAGKEVGKATAGADGSFAFVPDKPLPAGAGALSLETMMDGKLLVSKDQIAIVVTQDKPALVAKVEPEAPTKVVQLPSTGETPKEVQLSTVDYDQQGNIIFQGRVTPGGTVRFYVDNQVVGDAKSDEIGNWLFQGATPIAPGTHTLRADEIDSTGKVLSRAELPFLREEVGKVIAAAEAPQPAVETPVVVQSATTEPDQVQPKSDEPAAASVADVAPAPAEVVAAVATANTPSRIIIQPGNNLWRISREVYGKGKMFTVIWEANRDQIKNPNRIYPGQILTAPKS
jgi:nucleoid-associated protein YgaU